ncbi:LytR/AlgR family response regulator transcription factor [Dysgonomonas termitidis]|uniref:LytR/AlgR family response regulator transcription factor n=1 Tax=Dysgonomonas termitidis TaxID=1516126 RepID=A0ABV9KQW1_9BACT
MAEILKVLLVDDEFHARKLLSEYISKLPFLEIAGISLNIFEAMNIFKEEKIDILLLDIQMPEISGLEFARSLKNPPSIIFTTAYSEYAVESYELDVVDYLLKPIAFPRFLQAINKVIEKRNRIHNTYQVAQTSARAEEIEDNSIAMKSGHKYYKINYTDLLYIEGQMEYVTLHTVKEKIMVLASLKGLEERLPVNKFIRIHKSYIVSVKHLELIDKNFLHIAGKKLPIGRSFKEELLRRLEKM